ncbi:DNA topoisomerase [Xanthomonas euvesicatoria]
MRDLFVIEASGKLSAFNRALRGAGIDAEVVATLGHLYENPRKLSPLGIALCGPGEFIETHREVGKPRARDALTQAIMRCGRLIIATDCDPEGHAIANDVAVLASGLRQELKIVRLQLGSIDPGAITRALSDARQWTPDAGFAATGRRIVDRLIGGLCSDRENGIFVGRVQTALLGMCHQGLVRRRSLTMPIAALDGGAPFILTASIPPDVSDAEAVERMALGGRAAAVETVVESLQPPLDCASAMLSLESDLGLSIADAADLLQDLYERGEISYPRTSQRAFSTAGADSVSRLAKVRSVIAHRRENLPMLAEGEGPHEAIRLLGEVISLQKPASLRATVEEGALAIIGRRSVESGILVQRQHGVLERPPGWAGELSLSRFVGGGRAPWGARPVTEPRVSVTSPEAALVDAMRAAGIGRPSTFAAHAVRLAGSGLVDGRMTLTEAGRRTMSAAPAELCRWEKAADAESVLEVAGNVGQAVRGVLGVYGLSELVAKLPSVTVPMTLPIEEAETDDDLYEEPDELVYRFRP